MCIACLRHSLVLLTDAGLAPTIMSGTEKVLSTFLLTGLRSSSNLCQTEYLFSFFVILSIDLFLAGPGSSLLRGLFPRGCSASDSATASYHGGFSCCRAQALKHSLSSCCSSA